MKTYTYFFLSVLLFLFSPNLMAQSKSAKSSGLKTSSSLNIIYASAPWNKNSTKIDTAYIFVRGKKSGKIVKVLLSETEPDSSTFSGSFSLGWSDGNIQPEVYIPPQKIRWNKSAERKFISSVRKRSAKRKPVVLKKKDNGANTLDVYDTKAQAQSAYKAYVNAKKVEKEAKSLVEPAAEESAVEAAQLAQRQQRIAQLAAAAATREADRIRKEQLERQRAEELKKKQAALAAAERAKRQRLAKNFARQALEKYSQGDFISAEKLFRKSIDLDPSDTSYYFRYGVTLYRNEKYDDALVALKISNVDENTKVEKNYYMGLIHFRLKELEPALEKFREVRSSKHEIMAPSSAFYEGVILYGQEKYESAKEPFETVIDTSKDPNLDNQAEKYLERIASALNFKKEQQRKHAGSVTFGTTYDSNILFSPDGVTSQGSSTNDGGVRFLLSSTYSYRALYEKTHEFQPTVDFLYMYSIDDDFNRADPTLFTFTGPYTRKGVWKSKGFKLTFSPGYEILFMDPNNTGSRENILNSILFDTDVTLIMSNKWFASYELNIRSDDSLTSDSIGDNDADATKIELATSHSLFMDSGKKKAIAISGGITINDAKGKEKLYNRIDVGTSYTSPWKKYENTYWNAGLDVYHLQYPDSADSRKDTNFAISASLSKIQSERLTWSGSLSYANNSSNLDDNTYKRTTLLITGTYSLWK